MGLSRLAWVAGAASAPPPAVGALVPQAVAASPARRTKERRTRREREDPGERDHEWDMAYEKSKCRAQGIQQPFDYPWSVGDDPSSEVAARRPPIWRAAARSCRSFIRASLVYMGNGIKRLLPQLQSPQVAADRSRERMKIVALVATSAAPIPAQNHQRR